MNRKHKNKNKQCKPPNPVPPQKKIDEEKGDSDVKDEERVPEIVSEVVLDEERADIKNEQDAETPRKPKRNRSGKGKSEEIMDANNPKVSLDPPQTELKLEKQPENKAEVETDSIFLKEDAKTAQNEAAVPTSRKKKNKNKKYSDKDQADLVKQEEIISHILSPNIVEIANKAEAENLTIDSLNKISTNLIPIDSAEQENTQLKKKNKSKKNKNNKSLPEKSELNSDTHTTIKDDNSEQVSFVLSEVVKSPTECVTYQDKLKTESSSLQEPNATKVDSHIETIQNVMSLKEDSTSDSTKNKKKNKHKKSDVKKTLTEDNLSKEIDVPCIEDQKIVDIALKTSIDDIVKSEGKKSKDDGKEREQSTLECNLMHVGQPMKKQEIKKGDEKSNTVIIDEDTSTLRDVDKSYETMHFDELFSKETVSSLSESQTDKFLSNIIDPIVEEIPRKEQSMKGDNVIETKSADKLTNITTIESRQTDDEALNAESKSLPHQELHKNTKKNKKGKKVPNFFDTSFDITIEAKPLQIQTYSSNIENKNIPLEDNKNVVLDIKNDNNKQETTTIDLGVCEFDVKINEKNTLNVCDVQPHSIEYPRSTSDQGITDTNNNAVIADVSRREIQNLDVPVVIPDTPFITHVSPTQFQTFEAIRNTEWLPNVNITANKYDLKSKVIEVNKDMEDLRMSIEKSLAELTALEKTEQIPEFITIPAIEEKTLLSEKHVQVNKDLINLVIVPKIKQEGDEKIKEIEMERNRGDSDVIDVEAKTIPTEEIQCKPRKDKGKGKGKNKSKNVSDNSTLQATDASTTTGNVETISTNVNTTDESKKTDDKKAKSQKSNSTEESDSKQKQSDKIEYVSSYVVPEKETTNTNEKQELDTIDKFEDAMTSSVDDINKSFELIANEVIKFDNIQNKEEKIKVDITSHNQQEKSQMMEQKSVKIEEKDEKENPVVSHPKNLLGLPDIPVPSSKTDYKKEKNKTPNTKQAKVKIKDATEMIENTDKVNKQSKQSQTLSKSKMLVSKIYKSAQVCDSEEYVYKYSFRKVFLPNACHVCKKYLIGTRVPCNFCNLLFYCGKKHQDADWIQHQALCFAISTIVNLKGLKHIYGDAKEVIGQNYRLLRMQAIVSSEKILKRRLVAWEQEALLYPRICADSSCREWRQNCLKDCDGCGQIFYCADKPDHYPKSHLRWCKSYNLYHKLVVYQQTKGRLEPQMPTKIMADIAYELPEKINELLATMYEEKIDMDDLQYATLTQVATAPLTAAYCYQVHNNKINTIYANGVKKKPIFTIHIVGAELQFEADALYKWEIFFLHLKPDVKELRVVLVGPELNPSNLPLELLAKIKLCENCRQNNRKVVFSFFDKELYHDYAKGDDYTLPDLVCAFNTSLNRTIGFNGKDSWPPTIRSILKLRVPLCLTSYTPEELPKDLSRISEIAGSDYKITSEPTYNPYASIRPDRNFISDDEMPLLFKNYCYTIVSGTV